MAGSPSLRAPQLVGLRLCLYGPPPTTHADGRFATFSPLLGIALEAKGQRLF